MSENGGKNATAFDIFCSGPLLDMVQQSGILEESKSFVDMHMLMDADTVFADFQKLVEAGTPSKDDIEKFVWGHFGTSEGELEEVVPSDWCSNPNILEKILDPMVRKFASAQNDLWKTLSRKIKPLEHPERHTLIQVPNMFIIPGDRFREYYYWDTYWIVGGLLTVGMHLTVKGILENFLHIVNKYGFIPNGGRIYYLKRSQPPLLTPMMELYYQHTNDLDFLQANISLLEKEHCFWLEHRSVTVAGQSGKSHTLFQFNARYNTPRPEGYMTDVEAAHDLSDMEKTALYSNIASACESGWDFSTRWFRDKTLFKTIKTCDIVPVDLNVYLCWSEQLLAKFHGLLGNKDKQLHYESLATRQREAIDDVFWDETEGAWFDYDLKQKEHNPQFYPSNLFPLLSQCTNVKFRQPETAEKIWDYVKKRKVLEFPGGIPTSLIDSSQQWDFPNAWSPLVHFMLEALSCLPLTETKKQIESTSKKWIQSNMVAWQKSGHMFEKYDVTSFGAAGGGGEYKVQVGFGWTNGVVLMLLEKYPDVTCPYST